jgi:hypothetical protein
MIPLIAKIPAMAFGLRDADWLMMDQLRQSKCTAFLTINTNAHFLPDTIGH